MDMERVQVLSVKPIPSKDNLPGNNPPLSLPNLGAKKHSFSVRQVTSKSNFDFAKGRGSDKILANRSDLKEGTLSNEFSGLTLGPYSGVASKSTSSCFGRSHLRASYHTRIQTIPLSSYYSAAHGKRPSQEAANDFVYLKNVNSGPCAGLYRSNSSLELEHDAVDSHAQYFAPIKREYGSHGSINVNSKSFQPEDNLLSLLTNYRDGTVKPICDTGGSSPKGKSKIQKLWDKDRSIFKKFRGTKTTERGDKIETSSEISSTGSLNLGPNANAKVDPQETDGKMEEQQQKYIRRATLAHFDCLSLAAQLSATRIKSLLADRSNTTTGASAAAMAENSNQGGSTEELAPGMQKYAKQNHMLCSCAFFRNELGGDSERIVSLSRDIGKHKATGATENPSQLYRTTAASSIGLLEPQSGLSHWTTSLCPYANRSPTIEAIDQGSTFYSTYFQTKEHQNWFGIDDALGPTAVSIRKEKQDESAFDKPHSIPLYQYRIIIRTSELFTCQGTLREETQRGEKAHKSMGVKEVLEYICPQLNASSLKLGTSTTETEEALLRVDELGIHKKFKVGVLYCRSGQRTEEDMYNNETAGPAFSEFLELLGQRVRLKDFDKYRGGLDKKTDSTGHYSVYTQYHGCEIMFHVSTLLPFTPSNRKQLLRKRHIGNDIVTIVFQEPGAQPFSPKYIRSHFQHVFVVVQAINPCTENAMYSIAVSRFQDVPMFGPPIPDGATFPRSRKFTDVLLAKVINGELAALRSEKFSCMAARTKHEYLKDLATNHVTTTALETSSKFSLKGFARGSRKDKSRFKFVGDMSARGALSWNVGLQDATLRENVDSILAISIDSVVLFEESSASVVFATSTKSVLGWIRKPSDLMLFYHQGECLSVNVRPSDEDDEIVNEIVQRLVAVTQGAEAQELILRRNSAGLLGFNVQQDGIITEVEPYGLAAQTGLQQGSRIVEICKVTLATLSQEQMVDLLKTSQTVSVTVIPPHNGGSPRRGCNVPTCSFLLGCSEGDYENLTPPEKNYPTKSKYKKSNRCERSFSPPRSATSSGYGTGSSSHSFSLEAHAHQQDSSAPERAQGEPVRNQDFTGTISSTNSGHCNNWSESEGLPQTRVLQKPRDEYSPPPLPARLYQDKSRHVRSTDQQLISNEKWKIPAVPGPNFVGPDQGNYAIPQNNRPVSHELLDKTTMGSDGAASDYDNGPASHYDLLQLRYPLRRNSSPQPPLGKGHADKLDTRLKLSGVSDHVTTTCYQEAGLTSKKSSCSRSEDDLSASSKSSSPYGFQRTNASNSSPSLSRNQSPCQGLSLAPKDNAVLRLKPCQGRGPPPRSSNLQEELMRLINPDYLSDCDSLNAEFKERHVGPSQDLGRSKESLNSRDTSPQSLTQKGQTAAQFQTVGEREFTSRKSVFNRACDNPNQQSFRAQNHMLATVNAEGVLMTARPATVVSNPGQNLGPENREMGPPSLPPARSKEPRISPSENGPRNPLPANVTPQLEDEWNSLVDTARKATDVRISPSGQPDAGDLNSNLDREGSVSSFGSADSLRRRTLNANTYCGSDTDGLRNQSYYDSLNSNADCSQVPECATALDQYSSRSSLDMDSNYSHGVRTQANDPVKNLEQALVAEQQRTGQLEEEVTLLRTENRKLQEDSRAAAKQLHQFTEWFFSNIDKT